jgi:uncharacterized protein DUF2490
MKMAALFIGAIFLCTAHAAAQTGVVPRRDTQSWNDVQFTIPLNKKTEFALIGTLRIGDDITKPVDERWGIRFNYALTKYVSLQTSYFHREARPPNGKHEREERGTVGANLRLPLGKFTFNTRNWFERRWREPQVDAWRYRNRLQLEHPFKLGKTKFVWVLSDEPFYDWSLHDWVRNRFAVGVNHTFNKHFTLDTYFMRQNDGRARPGDLNIIGTTWRIKL